MEIITSIIKVLFLFVAIHINIGIFGLRNYEPTWSSLDSRPLPSWYDDSKIGIFIHWGVYSVPSFGSEWFWYNWREAKNTQYQNFMKKKCKPDFTYQEFASQFTAELFDPDEWANLFKNAGAKYVVITSKHHDGFALWPSKYSYSWNSNDAGPHIDILGALEKAVRKKGLIFGLYHSLYEWFHPLYLSDKASNFTHQQFVDYKMLPQMMELVHTYQPWLLWSDGDWEAPDSYFRSTMFLSWLYNDSPVKDKIVVNDRWGKGTGCTHGGYYSCEDRYNPGKLQHHKWENAMTIDKHSWGFRLNVNLQDYLTTHELITQVVTTVSCGGNILINVGPTKEGTIIPIFQERLLELGTWLSINGEAIYSSKSWRVQNDAIAKDVWYTVKENVVYAIVLKWPQKNILTLGAKVPPRYDSTVNVKLITKTDQLKLNWLIPPNKKQMDITFPDRASIESDYAWVIKFST